MKEITDTGYWNGDTAHVHHVHSPELSKWIASFLNKEDLIYDFGCGLGHYLRDLQRAGFQRLKGFEGDLPKKRVFDNIVQQDLTLPFELKEKGSVISLEVGEHIPKEYMDIYLDNITNFCEKTLIISWAVRGQAGFGHVNCLNNEEVIPLIEQRGFCFRKDLSEEARKVVGDNTPWFKNTILIFERC